MSTTMLDALVVGSGPAGAMAAHGLASAGLRVRVVERARLPRDKPCGGALAPQVRSIIPWDYQGLVQARTRCFANLFDHGRSVLHTVPEVEFVQRPSFDLHLVEQALALGEHIDLVEGWAASEVVEHPDHVELRAANGSRLRARYLVAADGAGSRIARGLGLNWGRLPAAAVDAEVRVTDAAWAREAGRATFNFFCVPGGYGWIFPKADNTLTCGVGCWRHRAGLPALMEAFLQRSFAAGEILEHRVLGHPIPLYLKHRTIATRRVCLVGDAASMVDPIMGEGIRFALLSGQRAARVIVGLLAGGEAEGGHCGLYQQSIQADPCQAFVNQARFILPMFLSASDAFYSSFIEAGMRYPVAAQVLAARFGLDAAPAPMHASASAG